MENRQQLLIVWASDDSDLKSWLQENRYMSHDPIKNRSNSLLSMFSEACLQILSCVLLLGMPFLVMKLPMLLTGNSLIYRSGG